MLYETKKQYTNLLKMKYKERLSLVEISIKNVFLIAHISGHLIVYNAIYRFVLQQQKYSINLLMGYDS